MKRQFLVLLNVVITFILALFGVACESRGADMYGTPIAEHSIKGTVKGVNDTKIGEVKVSIIDKNNHYKFDSTQTDSSGKYAFKLNALPQDTTKYILSFKDIDGDKNGSYLDKTTEVTILESELEGGEGGWNRGSVTKEIHVKLEEDKLN